MKNLVSIILISGLIWWLIRGKKETTETLSDKYVSTGPFSRIYSSTSSVSSSQSVVSGSSGGSVGGSTDSGSSDSSSTPSGSSGGSSSGSDSSGSTGGSSNPGGHHISADPASAFTNQSKSKSAFV
jgi:hypothetical protein